MASDIWYSTTQRGNSLPPHGLLFPINSKGSFICTNPTDKIAHTTAFGTPVVEHWLERELAQRVHHGGSIRRPIAPWANALTTELHLAPRCSQNLTVGSQTGRDPDRTLTSTAWYPGKVRTPNGDETWTRLVGGYLRHDDETLGDGGGHYNNARRDAVVEVVIWLESKRHRDAEEAEHHEVVDAHADHLGVVQPVDLHLRGKQNRHALSVSIQLQAWWCNIYTS